MSDGSRVAGGHLDLLLLSALSAAGEAHGYVLIGSLRDRTGGALDLPEGSVYPALQRLERAGAITGRWDDAATRPRRLYRLSPAGRAALDAKRKEWAAFAESMGRVVRWAPV